MALRLDQEKDIEIVRQAALILERENQRLVDRNVELTRRLLQAEGRDPAELQLEIARLEAQLATARKKLFGTSSEKRPSLASTTDQERAAQTGHGPREQKELASSSRSTSSTRRTSRARPAGARSPRWRGSSKSPRRSTSSSAASC